ncbi:UPF0045 protein M15 [Yamadazyma tenuis]|uniref:Thiamine-binding protein domain-containing protein n=1 Tax=Candida tenuis (strain ATCC 10573 / BCRC 21748 / CBS 615 / JCM 9827 / NBRC 10315 / NRRL Y-1498 / VKM Y-70) TaxID=590646 RepID=G3BC68_CANTC|nr:uncharacterized protein CANTEDRAFT_116156 [Yamadazyma tenuis ATCC 10573]EGV60133.1 hypothetical protein CANTEDRAFT_116156 [Yamadazyma tenuis ATCC 10573]WEJ94635.1 UPF0045 protein M15 [Yamadazyma tenuis]
MVSLNCIADVCIVPIGTGSASVSDEVTLITKFLRENPEGLTVTLHSAGTTIEGNWDVVMGKIGQMHELLHHHGVVRIQSDIRVGTRTDKSQKSIDKVRIVEEKLKKLV